MATAYGAADAQPDYCPGDALPAEPRADDGDEAPRELPDDLALAPAPPVLPGASPSADCGARRTHPSANRRAVAPPDAQAQQPPPNNNNGGGSGGGVGLALGEAGGAATCGCEFLSRGDVRSRWLFGGLSTLR